MKRSLIAFLLLAGCAAGDPGTDFAGNVYPVECTVAATIAEPADRIPIDPDLLQAFDANPNHRVYGAFIGAEPGKGVIFYDETLRGWLLADVLRHEGCHAVRLRTVGDIHWHGDVKVRG